MLFGDDTSEVSDWFFTSTVKKTHLRNFIARNVTAEKDYNHVGILPNSPFGVSHPAKSSAVVSLFRD
jgi:hypothetical protein